MSIALETKKLLVNLCERVCHRASGWTFGTFRTWNNWYLLLLEKWYEGFLFFSSNIRANSEMSSDLEIQAMPESLKGIKHIVLILSGKGGVGKSSVTTQTALTLCLKGFKVGVLDIDLTGPSLPRMFGMEKKQVYQDSRGWIPVSVPVGSSGAGELKLMSLGFLLDDRGNSVVWRGPKKSSMIKQFIKDVDWGQLDYLIIDTPPGTSDEHISIAEELRWASPDGAIIVTTPQGVATADVRKEINFCKKVNFNIIGVVENMSGFICPHCAECTDIFSRGGGFKLAQEYDIPYLGNIPIDPTFVELIEKQTGFKESLVDLYKDSSLYTIFSQIIDKVVSGR